MSLTCTVVLSKETTTNEIINEQQHLESIHFTFLDNPSDCEELTEEEMMLMTQQDDINNPIDTGS